MGCQPSLRCCFIYNNSVVKPVIAVVLRDFVHPIMRFFVVRIADLKKPHAYRLHHCTCSVYCAHGQLRAAGTGVVMGIITCMAARA